MPPCIFLDRDGVLIEDVHLLTDPRDIRILSGVPRALIALRDAGHLLVVVTNQTVVARGLASMAEVVEINFEIDRRLRVAGAKLDAWYVCPHHPNATLAEYRVDCDCRKPRPGMIHRAAADHRVDLARSYLVGDRPTDIAAGATAGCRTIQVTSGRHVAPLIETTEPLDPTPRPDHVCATLLEAAEWILADEGCKAEWRPVALSPG